MSTEITVALVTILTGGAISAGVSTFAPLSTWEVPTEKTQTVAVRSSAFEDSLAMCRAQLSGVDCGCFAQKSSEILKSDAKRSMGWSYANKWELARMQATKSCS